MEKNLVSIRDELTARNPLPDLFPQALWKADLKKTIELLPAPPLVKAGLHCWNDDLGSAHHIAQENDGSDGNYWHAIMHRRESDFSNSKYWYGTLGKHPIWETMHRDFPEWSANWFVDQCQSLAEMTSPSKELRARLEQIQACEMARLLAHVWK